MQVMFIRPVTEVKSIFVVNPIFSRKDAHSVQFTQGLTAEVDYFFKLHFPRIKTY